MTSIENLKIERKKDVIRRVALSKATLHRYINAGIFPPSISLGARSVGFLSHEIDAFIAAKALNQDLSMLVESLLKQREELSASFLSFFPHSANKEGN